MENILRRVKTNLSAKFYATNDTWLTDCVEYYLSEHNNPSDAEVLEFVISQWQLSDLREISNEKPSLPRNLAQQKCTTLRGHFVLQMEKIYDIGESKYKQLEKIRNISTDNVQATEVEATQAWEPKKKRMLQLFLTDGVQDVIAIEYKPVRFLHDKMLPGYKLMIKGPVICRRGVIMLDETNISEIGGEIESLLIPNATENILARALNLPENPDPYNDKSEQPSGPENPAGPADEIVFDDDFDIDMVAVELIEKSSQEESTNSTIRSVSASNRAVNRVVQPRHERADDLPLARQSESDLLFEAIDVNEFDDLPEIAPKSRPVSKTISANPSLQNSEFPDSDEEYENQMEVAPEPRNVPKMISKNPVRVLPEDFLDDEDDELILNADNARSCAADSWRKPSSDAKPDCQIDNISKLKIETNAKASASSSVRQTSEAAAKQSAQTGNKRPAAVLSPPVLNPPAEKVRCTINTPKSNKVDRKITDFTKANNHAEVKPTAPKITDYLKKNERPENKPPRMKLFYDIAEVLAADETHEVARRTVKGKLEKLDKLTTEGDSWVLNGTLRDATGSIEVKFSSQVLESMLGFSVAEFKLKKKMKKKNPEIEDQLRQSFRNAETKIITLDDLLELELTPGEKAKIVKITEMAEARRELLERTVKLIKT